jgi:hypothetical protein
MQMMGNTLPPSPDSSVLLPSPSSSCTEDNSDQNLNTNNIGFPQRC